MDTDRSMDIKHDLDKEKLKALIVTLQKNMKENEKLRTKYPQNPRKFASSETELFANLDQLQSVAGHSELYGVLVEKKILSLLTSLIYHENHDISGKVINVIQELSNIEHEDRNSDTEKFVELISHFTLGEVLVDNIERFDKKKKDEAEVINNTINLLSYLINDCFMTYGGTLFSHRFIIWSVEQLEATKFDVTKLSMIDLLITLINDPENIDFFSQEKGIGALLQQIAYYRRVAPSTGSEKEYLYQVLYCLCYMLQAHDDEVIPSKDMFFEEEGVELVELILRERRAGIQKTAIKHQILKAFDICISPNPYAKVVTQCCEKFIEVLGLRVLFPIFLNPRIILPKAMKTPELTKYKLEVQEYTIRITTNLLKHCQKPEHLQRILIKFAEKNFEKFDHLIKLLVKYFQDYKQCLNQLEETQKREENTKNLPDKCDHLDSILSDLNYMFLLICFLGDELETYDVNSGEKFTNRVKKLLIQEKPELKDAILDFAREMAKEHNSEDEKRDKNSLGFLVEYLEKISTIETKT